jgi:hypothetical protein
MRSLPFPRLDSVLTRAGITQVAIYLPLAAIAAFVLSAKQRRSREWPACIRTLAALLAGLSALLFIKGIVRVSLDHMQPAILASVGSIALSMEVSIDRSGLPRVACCFLAATMLFVAGTSAYQRLGGQRPTVIQMLIQRSEDEHSGRRLFMVDSDRRAAIKYVRERTAPGSRTFVGVGRHDKIFMNDVAAYFLMDRLPVTKWHHFDPGLQTSASIQHKIIAELEASPPSYVWIESTWDNIQEPNESALASGVTFLDDYIRSHYASVQRFGEIDIRARIR